MRKRKIKEKEGKEVERGEYGKKMRENEKLR
jgi:hypothetical protein